MTDLPFTVTETAAARRGAGPLDSIGQRNELLRVRFSQMVDRLEDLKSLTEDFALLADPIEEIVVELPRAKARILESEALLARELEASHILRREVDSLSSRLSAASGELSTVKGRCHKLESAVREQEGVAEEHRLTLREKTLLVDNLARQLFVESEQRQTLAADLKLQRAEAQANEHALVKSEALLAQEFQQRSLYEQEAQRLQKLAEEQGETIIALQSLCGELDQQREGYIESIAALEAHVASEQAARQKSDADHDADIGALNSERSSLTLKVDALTARLSSMDQILAQVRGQLRDKDEAFRIAERSAKEAAGERVSFDRRIDNVRAELAHHSGQLQESQRARSELEDRCDMLTKAVAAKDAALENANSRVVSLSDRVEGLTLRFEHDRMNLEAINRRLIEEVENEKAERTLAQGALDIARESRFSLQRQNESLKRVIRVKQNSPDEDSVEIDVRSADHAPVSNVSFFAAPDKRE